jgi:hypothetical protein
VKFELKETEEEVTLTVQKPGNVPLHTITVAGPAVRDAAFRQKLVIELLCKVGIHPLTLEPPKS